MKRLDTERKSVGGASVSSATETRVTGRWLIVARAVWLALVIPSLGLFVAGLPVYYQLLQRACGDPVSCNTLAGVLTAKEIQALTTSGFSVSAYAALLTIFLTLLTLLWCGIGFLIFWRRSDDWLALVAALFLVFFGITSSANPILALAIDYPALAFPAGLVELLGYVSLVGFFLLFPNGRLVPRWMGLVLLFVVITALLSNFPSPAAPFIEQWPAWLSSLLIFLVPLPAIILSQLYRYRRVSTPVQRQQTKWIVLGVTVAVGVVLGLTALGLLFPTDVNANALGTTLLANILFPLAVLLIPLSIGFSILRYRLYDIDVLINRTLVYGSLTVLLALLYVGLIVVLQALFQGLFHQNNAVAIVVSTLVIAALFQPLRHRMQALIDRRFYRRKYDAARTLAAFSATLRSEVDLATLSEHLVAVVQETMQPTHISLWLSKDEQRRKPHIET